MRGGSSKYFDKMPIEQVAAALAEKPMSIPEIVVYMGYNVETAHKSGAIILMGLENAGVPIYQEGKKYGVLTNKLMDKYDEEHRKEALQRILEEQQAC